MKKGLIFGIAAGVAAVAAAVIYFKKKQTDYYYEEDFDDELDCDCCGECCDCDDDECKSIPADKAEESMIMTDSCVACGATEEEALAAIDDEVEPDSI